MSLFLSSLAFNKTNVLSLSWFLFHDLNYLPSFLTFFFFFILPIIISFFLSWASSGVAPCAPPTGSAKVVDLVWLLEGQELDSSWAAAGEGVVVNQLQMVGVEQRLRGAHLSCRLTTVEASAAHTAANITYRSANIAMFCELVTPAGLPPDPKLNCICWHNFRSYPLSNWS